MLATAVLGVGIAFLFGLGIKTIYKNFFKGEAECCKSECGGQCSCCHAHKSADHTA